MNKQLLTDLITQAEAARLRGVTPTAIRNLIRRGRLTSIEIAGLKLLLKSEVENFKELPTGRPKNLERVDIDKHLENLDPNKLLGKKGPVGKKEKK